MFPEIHYCPTCNGALGADCYAEITAPDYPFVVTRLLCEFCNEGWEAVWRRVSTGRRLVGRTHYAADANPADYGKFCRRLARTLNDRSLVRAGVRNLAKAAVC